MKFIKKVKDFFKSIKKDVSYFINDKKYIYHKDYCYYNNKILLRLEIPVKSWMKSFSISGLHILNPSNGQKCIDPNKFLFDIKQICDNRYLVIQSISIWSANDLVLASVTLNDNSGEIPEDVADYYINYITKMLQLRKRKYLENYYIIEEFGNKISLYDVSIQSKNNKNNFIINVTISINK